MAENQNTWFDDPEWDELRNKINRRKGKKRGHKEAASQPAAPDFSQYHHAAPQLRQATTPFAEESRPKRPVFEPSAVPRPSYRPMSQSFGPTQPTPEQPVEPFFTPSKDSKRDKPVDAFEAPRDDRPVQVSINLSLPTVDTLEPLLRRLKRIRQLARSVKARKFTTKQLRVAGAVAVLLVVGLAGFKLVPRLLGKDKSDVLATNVAKPTFAVATPESGVKPENQVVFDGQKKVASYRDQIDGIGVIISQQELPESFKSDPFGKLEEVAKGFNATDSFVVKDFKVYIGTSAKGPQSVILIKDKRLIFMRSDSKILNTSWVSYIETLKTT